MHRALCPVETLYVGQRSRAVLSCTLRGPVDVAALSAAYDTMTEANPGLRSRIEQDRTGHVLRLLDEDERPRLDIRSGDGEEAWAQELNRPLPVGGPLSRAVLVSAPNGESHLFVLVVDHTVTDGHSSIALLNALWDRYRALVGGEPADETPRPRWPEPVSRLLPPADAADTAKYLDGRLEETRRHPVALVPYDAVTGDGSSPEGRIEVRPADPGRRPHRAAAPDGARRGRLRARADRRDAAGHGTAAAGRRRPPHPRLPLPRRPALPADPAGARGRPGARGHHPPADPGRVRGVRADGAGA
ncbi:hypothetical protein SGLAM104S_03363 [Streptomyces glaucescens]